MHAVTRVGFAVMIKLGLLKKSHFQMQGQVKVGFNVRNSNSIKVRIPGYGAFLKENHYISSKFEHI